MSWVVTAVVGTAVVSSYTGKKSTEAQVDAANTQLAESRRQFDILQEQYQPFRETGLAANEQLNRLLAGDRSGFEQDPGTQLMREEGERSINRLAAQQGRLNTGAQAKDLARFNQQLASQGYNQYVNRLLSISGRGQAATGDVSQARMAATQQQGVYTQNAANARASGYINQGNIINNALDQYLKFNAFNTAQAPTQGSLY